MDNTIDKINKDVLHEHILSSRYFEVSDFSFGKSGNMSKGFNDELCVSITSYKDVDKCNGELVTPGERPECFNSDGTRATKKVEVASISACSEGSNGSPIGTSTGSPTGTSGTSGGGGGVGTNSGGTNGGESENCSLVDKNGNCVALITSPTGLSERKILVNTIVDKLGLSIFSLEVFWLNDFATEEELSNIDDFLKQNEISPGVPTEEAKEIIKAIIDFFKELDWKQELKKALADGITSTAELTHKIYKKLSQIAQQYPSSVSYINTVVDEFREIADDAFDTNPQTLDWLDLFGIWLFELGDYPQDVINFDGDDTTTESLKQQEGVNEARDKALIKIQNNDIDEPVNNGWTYGQGEFYDGMADGNIATSFLGSYNTKVDITQNPDGTHTLTFTVSNPSTWESATRLRIDNDNDGNHDGIFPNTSRGDDNDPNNKDINLGGTINQTWIWTEIVN